MQPFDPPGFLNDFSSSQKAEWSAIVSQWLDRAQKGDPAANDGPRGQFFNRLTNTPSGPTAVAKVAWNAFPRQV